MNAVDQVDIQINPDFSPTKPQAKAMGLIKSADDDVPFAGMTPMAPR
jgi:hypothetical protein